MTDGAHPGNWWISASAKNLLLLLLLLFILTANGFLPGGSGTTIRHNPQIAHIKQNNTPHSNKTQHKKYANNKGHITHNEYNENTLTTTTTNTITTTII
jgi:hypothetical protein